MINYKKELEQRRKELIDAISTLIKGASLYELRVIHSYVKCYVRARGGEG